MAFTFSAGGYHKHKHYHSGGSNNSSSNKKSNMQVSKYNGSQSYNANFPVGYKVSKTAFGWSVENQGTCSDGVHKFVESKKGNGLYCEHCGVKQK